MAREKTPRMNKVQLRKMRQIVFVRDDWTCQDCGVQVLPEADNERSGQYAPRTAGLCLELDHIVPRSFGGPSTPENLRAACSDCNGRKRASLAMASWEMRFAEAIRIMTEQKPSLDTARRAIAVLEDYR